MESQRHSRVFYSGYDNMSFNQAIAYIEKGSQNKPEFGFELIRKSW